MRRLRSLLAIGIIGILAMLLVIQLWNSRSSEVMQPSSGALRIASHNVHYILLNKAEGRWSVGDWMKRRHALDAAFKELDADIVAFQEMESFQGGNDGSVNLARDYLLARNPSYRVAASDDWRSFPSTQPIFYRSDRLTPIEQGWFFFSETPDRIYSRTYNGSYPAYASWAQFRDRRWSKPFRIVNLHFDFQSSENRLRSADLVASRIRPWIEAGETVFVAGDLNALIGSRTAGILREAGLGIVNVPGATYHFGRGLNLFGAIDHILYTCDIAQLGRPMVLRNRFEDVYPSDHYPVITDFRLPSRDGNGDCRNQM